MYLDVIDMRDFYATAVGAMVARHVGEAITRMGLPGGEETVLGIGYAIPYLDVFLKTTRCVWALMPAAQGVVEWPVGAASRTALVDEANLPLPDACIDRVLLVHAVEGAADPEQLLAEVWRILKPGGHVTVVVPSRQGPWARSDHSPFGFGRPFSRSQLRSLVRAQSLALRRWDTALHMSPWHRPRSGRAAAAFERFGHKFWPALAGVILADLEKEVRQPVTAKVAVRQVGSLRPAAVRHGAASCTCRFENPFD